MAKKKAARQAAKSTGIWWVAGAAVAAVAVLIALSLSGAKPKGGDGPAAVAPGAHGVVSDAELGAVRNKLGQDDAKVKLVEFGDYL